MSLSVSEQRDVVNAVLIAERSEETLMAWCRRLPVDHRRQVVGLLLRCGATQRAVDLWQDACNVVDEST